MTIFYHPMLTVYGIYRSGGGEITRFLSDHPWMYVSLLGVAAALAMLWKYRR